MGACFLATMGPMRLKSVELSGFKSFAKKTPLSFESSITAVVGPNGSGKSNIAESFRFALGEQSMKSMRGKRGEDLIWNGSAQVPRGGRASVKLVFDNRDRSLSLDFDEVSIERVVHRDGGNDYLLNGSSVRLRDIAELLAGANIGASGHHIISQGEADRILSAGVRERREMIEDALGLTAFLYKREEAERKLQKSADNMKEVEALRRELAPHLKFLNSQVKKIEEAQSLREELKDRYLEYLKRESVYLKFAEATLGGEQEAPEGEHKELDARIVHLREELGRKRGGDHETQELIRLEQEGRTAAHRRQEIMRELGRIEGSIAAHEAYVPQEGTIPVAEARQFGEKVLSELELPFNDTNNFQQRVQALIILTADFLRRITQGSERKGESVTELASKKDSLEAELRGLEAAELQAVSAIAALRLAIESEKDASRDAERELFAAMARRSELESRLSQLRARAELLNRDRESLVRNLAEAAALVGREIADYESHPLEETNAEAAEEDRARQAERARRIERLKIKLEESGLGSSSDVLREHQETTERDAFLGRELADLEASRVSLMHLIEELTKTLEVRFGEGIEKINKEFDAFFKLMFGGGAASLQIVREKKARRGASEEPFGEEEPQDGDSETEQGIDLTVSLPHKRLKGIHMLSGGERALTSIALIFAMSQVNPPPFLILDETEAALDEANSRRYGDMIETLSKRSQLIVITHNRETMSRAGILYGITMGSDGASKLLSVKFEEAVAVAK
ncbi:MAG: Smc, chromosome segregation ATPase, chromosome segregation protein [Candidatus Adlerbacteria bacterium]|nr:Smc, chromosome segregation ATPase, chromosome segregation protein [Candidatus Adlerbacteria bacterium]